MSAVYIVHADDLTEFCIRLFMRVGTTETGATMVARNLVRANLQGVDSHGISRVARYLDQCKKRVIVPGSEFVTKCDTGPLIRVEAGQEFGQIVLSKVLALACERVKQFGTVTAFIGNCNHIGQLGWGTGLVAEEHQYAILMAANVNGVPRVAPYGASTPRMGTNPMSCALPTFGSPASVVVDFAACQVVEGKTNIAHKTGKKMPLGYLVDPIGQPTETPGVLYAEPPGAILPLGGMLTGFKGSAFSVLIDLFAGGLSGSGWAQPGRPLGMNGVWFNIVDPLRLGFEREELAALVAGHREWITAAKALPGVDEVLYPGDVEARCAELRSGEGIPVPEAIWNELVGVAGDFGEAPCASTRRAT